MSKKFIFDAIGRDLFADEVTVLAVFNAKYQSPEIISQEEADKRMRNVRQSVKKNKPRVSSFFTEVEATKKTVTNNYKSNKESRKISA